jgi:hypothetical protein
LGCQQIGEMSSEYWPPAARLHTDSSKPIGMEFVDQQSTNC